MPNDIGRNRIIAIDAESPGIEPNIIPVRTPAKIRIRQLGLSSTIEIASDTMMSYLP